MPTPHILLLATMATSPAHLVPCLSRGVVVLRHRGDGEWGGGGVTSSRGGSGSCSNGSDSGNGSSGSDSGSDSGSGSGSNGTSS